MLAVVAIGVTGTTAGSADAAPLPVGRAAGVPVAGPTRALWVWDQPAAKTLVAFAQARGVTDLFVSVPPNLPSSARLTWVRSLSKLAVPAGIRLQALGGDPGWIDDPGAAVAWQTAALSTGLFTGSHVDLEPWQHPGWGSDQPTVVRGYLDTLSRLAAATTLPVEADLSFWLWTVTDDAGEPVDAAVLDRVDRVTVMSYRNTVTGDDSITGTGAHTLATAATAGKPCRLAIETNDLGSDPVSRKQTFYGMRESVANTAMNQVDTAEAGNPSYAGMAVEDYAGYDALR